MRAVFIVFNCNGEIAAVFKDKTKAGIYKQENFPAAPPIKRFKVIA